MVADGIIIEKGEEQFFCTAYGPNILTLVTENSEYSLIFNENTIEDLRHPLSDSRSNNPVNEIEISGF